MKPIHIDYVCPECDKTTRLLFYPGSEPIVAGPPERCDPGSAAEIEPTECKHCHAEIDIDEIEIEAASGPDPDELRERYEDDKNEFESNQTHNED